VTAHVAFKLPKLGLTMQDATVEEWLVSVGDRVAAGQDLVVISTDKVDSALASPASGEIAAIVVERGTTVEPGTMLAVIRTA
jgi:pyruvate/2-oxoglutarate dehydrogenase complex dihydrolipoamide acyltransferase (E2) component